MIFLNVIIILQCIKIYAYYLEYVTEYICNNHRRNLYVLHFKSVTKNHICTTYM